MVMRRILQQSIAVLCAGFLVGLPVSAASANNLVGVATGSGQATINGQQIYGQASVYSGDWLQTGEKSPLTVVAAPQERIQLAADSRARLLKNAGITKVSLEQGSLDFESVGSTLAVLGATGVEVRPAGTTQAIARLTAMPKGVYQVSVAKGAVDVVNGGEATTVDSGHMALVGTPNADQPPNSDKNDRKKKVVVVLLLAGANFAAVAAVLANEGSRIISPTAP